MFSEQATNIIKSNQKRRNHEVSKCLLAQWLDKSDKNHGHHYFDIQNQTYIFELGKNAKFAATEYLYMPNFDDGKRAQDLEDWLSFDESGLGLLCKAAAAGNSDLIPNDSRLLKRGLRACVSLGMRSAYSFYMIAQIPNLADLMETDTAHQALAKNASLAIQRRFSYFMNWDFKILYDLSVPLLVNEQPFRDWGLRAEAEEHISMPLTSTALLLGSPPESRDRTFAKLAWYSVPGRPRVSEMHNDFIVKTARQWVVGISATQVKDVAPQLSANFVRERSALDQIVFQW